MNWMQFEQAAPEIAAFARAEFERSRVMLIGTIRKDGSPRICMIEPFILDGELYLGMMWRSRKAIDLLRDPRLVLHNAVCSASGQEGEISIRGRALEIQDLELRRKYIAAVAERISWREPHFHLFSLDIESASLIEYDVAQGMQARRCRAKRSRPGRRARRGGGGGCAGERPRSRLCCAGKLASRHEPPWAQPDAMRSQRCGLKCLCLLCR
jgi:hypothetical protein